jgi:hypothetical protein
MTHRRFVLCFVLVSAAVAVGFSCSSDTPLLGISQACVLNSDCSTPLLCVFQKCHNACVESRDCPMGQRCVASGTSHICQLPEESTCVAPITCQALLVCGPDLQCRSKCATAADCAKGDSCLLSGATSVCYAPSNASDALVISGNGGSDGGGSDGSPAGVSTDGASTDAPPLTCTDKVKSGDETDVDCGGSCTPCPIDKACLVASDCASKGCVEKTCRECAPGTTQCTGKKQSTCNNGLWVVDNNDCISGCDTNTGACRVCKPSTCQSVRVIFHGAIATQADVQIAVDEPNIPRILSVDTSAGDAGDAGDAGTLVGQKTVLFGNFTVDKTQHTTDNVACSLPNFAMQTNIYYLAQLDGLAVKSTWYAGPDGGSVDFQDTQYCQACPNFGCDNYISTPKRIDKIEIQANGGDLTCKVCLYRAGAPSDATLIKCVGPNTSLTGADLAPATAPALLQLDDGKRCALY